MLAESLEICPLRFRKASMGWYHTLELASRWPKRRLGKTIHGHVCCHCEAAWGGAGESCWPLRTARCCTPQELGAEEAAYAVGADASEAMYAVGPSWEEHARLEWESLPPPVYFQNYQVTKPAMPAGKGEIFTDLSTIEEAVMGLSAPQGQYIDNCYNIVLWLLSFHIHSSIHIWTSVKQWTNPSCEWRRSYPFSPNEGTHSHCIYHWLYSLPIKFC